jgi:hypothetical protein
MLDLVVHRVTSALEGFFFVVTPFPMVISTGITLFLYYPEVEAASSYEILLLYVYVSSSCQLALFGYPD